MWHVLPRPLLLPCRSFSSIRVSLVVRQSSSSSTSSSAMKFQFAIDRGGTFTDVFARRSDTGAVRVMKLLSEDPQNYSDAPREGIRRVLEAETGRAHPAGEPLDAGCIEWIRMGTTVATNALLERKGERCALLVTKGFRDLLFIGNQARPELFNLNIAPPSILYEEVIEVDERIFLDDPRCELDKSTYRQEESVTKEKVFVTAELNEEPIREELNKLLQKGVQSLAVVFMHSYMHPVHEERVGKLAREMGFRQVSLSSEVMPMIRIVNRGFTASVDAYLTPCIRTYVDGFASGFKGCLRNVNVTFMQSDGGLTRMSDFCGSRAIISGPAGGVVGYARTTHGCETDQPVIGFDMGGTSTDVSRFAGEFDHVFESSTAGVTVQAPQLDINTVAAGGGSMLFFRAGLFAVGPESAGAHPGPICYKKGGHLTITDANLCLGRILPQHFPKIFGPNEDEPLDAEATRKAFEKLTAKVNKFHEKEGKKERLTAEEVAMGFVRVANETMCRPIRALTQGKGHDTSHHVLACFGGAGGQHACAIARSLGMSEVYIHKYAGILSAYGMALADVVHEEQLPCAKEYRKENFGQFVSTLKELKGKCRQELRKQGFSDPFIETECFLHLRYDKTDWGLMCTAAATGDDDGGRFPDYLATFLKRYQTEMGFTLKNRPVIVDDIRVRGVGKTELQQENTIPVAETEEEKRPGAEERTQIYFERTDGEGGFLDTGVFMLKHLKAGAQVTGPAIIMDELSTILVEPDCEALVSKNGNLKICVGRGGGRKKLDTAMADTVQLSIFSHRFMSIAEQMGRVLRRTSISTNIKERLDFSCALFGPDGGLVSNAPHIPVHLGAMQDTVRHQMRHLGSNLNRGDVILANHPKAGGSHLPDLTVITPVFYSGEELPVFFVANRGHHADIGGISPGSMPPHSNFLWQEGARFKSFKIVDGGDFQEEKLVEAFMEPGKYEGSSGSRCLQDNLSDLKAQIAANQKGIQLVSELIDSYGLDVVQAYMGFIQKNAEVGVREMLTKIGQKMEQRTGQSILQAEDFMDDGSRLSLKVKIDNKTGSAVFDFAGTGPQVWGNTNAPRAVTFSAIIYCLRCMIGHDVPLNQGCLEPVKVLIPEGCLLDPSEDSAVVGGNVLTSQRVVDVVFKAFEACAASQGCCNNVTFGDDKFGYYETVAGGSGAGPTWDGRSGVHVHMTNTRLTDPEILERRYPVALRRFSLAPGTGGTGRHRGGDGVLREILFRKDLMLSILTERRVLSPYGLKGGAPGERGVNILMRDAGTRAVNLGGKCSVQVAAGEVFCLQTPGGGGWGVAGEDGGSGDTRGDGGESPSKVKKYVAKGSLHDYQQAQLSA